MPDMGAGRLRPRAQIVNETYTSRTSASEPRTRTTCWRSSTGSARAGATDRKPSLGWMLTAPARMRAGRR
eukprot:6759488-Alexandrium_andersonii.AAC.1